MEKELLAKDTFLCKGKLFYLYCRTHVLNLVVQEGLKDIDQVVLKIHESVKYVRGSQLRKQNFRVFESCES